MIETAVKRFSRHKGYRANVFSALDDLDAGIRIYDGVRTRRFYHSGDFGDIVYALPVIRALGGGDLLLGPQLLLPAKVVLRQVMSAETVELFRPLLTLQPYIKSVSFSPLYPDVDFDLNQFREELFIQHELMASGHRMLNLAECHLKRFRLRLDECQTPWLVVDREESVKGRPVVIHRSTRWRNSDFPWSRVLEEHGDHAVFVGLDDEHADFVKEHGPVPHVRTSNFLELARLIAGSELFIGNQSLPNAIAEGLKKTTLLEVWPEGPNCFFARSNANYGLGKTVYIPKLKRAMAQEKLTCCPVCESNCPVEVSRQHADFVKCRSCQVVYLRTRMSPASMVHHYQSYADGDSHMRLPTTVEEIRSSGLRRDYFMKGILENVKHKRGRFLDVGSGWGAFLANARNNGFDVCGIEVCHKMADFANSVLGVPTWTQQLEDVPLIPDGTLSVVSAIHALEHLPWPGLSMRVIWQRLAPEGLFCGIVPNFDSFCSTTLKADWPWLDPNHHYTYFSVPSLARALAVNRFEVVSMATKTGDYGAQKVIDLIQALSPVPVSDAEVNSSINRICDSMRGEEIHFFAKKPCQRS